MSRRLLALALVALGVAALAGEAEAHRRRARYGYRARVGAGGAVVFGPGGFYSGVGLTATKIIDQRGGPEQLDDGAGVSLYGGFRVGERLALEVGWLGSLHNPSMVSTVWGTETDFLVLEALTADCRIYLTRRGDLDPYLQGGLGFYFLGSERFGLDAAGSGFQLGGGFDYYLADRLVLGLRVRYHGVAMGPPEGGEAEVFISAATVEGALAVHF
jgi:opacity protein-like surface antigen